MDDQMVPMSTNIILHKHNFGQYFSLKIVYKVPCMFDSNI